MKCKSEAQNHFKEAARTSEKTQDIQMAVAEICLTLLDSENGSPVAEANVLEATELLEKHDLWRVSTEVNADVPRDWWVHSSCDMQPGGTGLTSIMQHHIESIILKRKLKGSIRPMRPFLVGHLLRLFS